MAFKLLRKARRHGKLKPKGADTMNIAGIVVLVVIAVGAFALTLASKSAGRGECGGRCTGCGKCGKKKK